MFLRQNGNIINVTEENIVVLKTVSSNNPQSFSYFETSMFYQIFLSPQVKPCAIITYKHGMYELPHELLNDLIIIRKNQESV